MLTTFAYMCSVVGEFRLGEANMAQDRRVRRSQRPRIASRYCLQSVTRRHRLSAMVLADDQGRFVAGAEGEPCGPGFLANRVAEGYGRQLAALGPASFEADAEIYQARFGEPVRATPVLADGRRFYLVTVGSERATQAAVAAAGPAIVRIFDCAA